VDITCASLLETMNAFEQAMDSLMLDMERLTDDNDRLSNHIHRIESSFKDLKGMLRDGVEYDEDLDHATIDMMEALVASGASEPTFDGELSFQEAIVISKEDFKPIVRQAIESWLRLKVR